MVLSANPSRLLEVPMLPQPTEETCGPTCLHAVYRYYGEELDLNTLISEVNQVQTGGTLAVMLGNHALERGYRARIYTYNLTLFDPTWFELDRQGLEDRLERQREQKADPKLEYATQAYLRYLRLGGELLFEELTPELIIKHLNNGTPILTGLSATYLYRMVREIPGTNLGHDTLGEPVGHFVVISGYEEAHMVVADPLDQNPLSPYSQQYAVRTTRLINAILLGMVTYDANLLIIEPK